MNQLNLTKNKILFADDFINLPKDIQISTMTVTCKINTIFNIQNIAKYTELKRTGIVSVKHGKNNRSLMMIKRINKNRNNNKNQKKAFYNQVSLQVITENDKTLNIKLFLNGSIQITGCKSIEGITEAIQTVFNELKTTKAIIDFKLNTIVEKPFVTDSDKLYIDNLYDLKICMINSNFSIGFEIDRDKLFEEVVNDSIKCSYDPNIHACVNIKYEYLDKIISVFVFESGAIIITGAHNCDQITGAYNFINKYLLERYVNINKNNSLTISMILECIESEENNQ
jgi:TATA-box binding protein (TBP) (component of TFIID and TFIIIB)